MALVSVNVPVYHQIDLARRCVDSIRAQSFTDFELTLLDDGQSAEYEAWVAALGDPRVKYRANNARLGAMQNLFQAVSFGAGKYSLAFHEDDLLGVHYLSAAVAVLERHPECAFVVAEVNEFEGDPAPAALRVTPESSAYDLLPSGAEFVRAILRGRNLMFGSAVYRRSALADTVPRHDEYGTLVDRPYLVALLDQSSCAMLRQPLAWYRRHGAGDERHHGMRADHILALLQCYRDALPQPLSPDERLLLHDYSGYWLLKLYSLLPDSARPALAGFVYRAWREGVYDPFRERGIGRARLLRAMATGGGLSYP